MHIRFLAIILAVLLGVGVTHAQEGLTRALCKQVVEAKDKLTIEEVLKLVPGPFTVKRNTGPINADLLVLTWEEVNRIRVEFSEGKVTSVSGTISKAVASETLTLTNFMKIAKGMSRKEVGELLDRKPGAKVRVPSRLLPGEGGKPGRQVWEWVHGRSLTVIVQAGKLVGAGCADSTGD